MMEIMFLRDGHMLKQVAVARFSKKKTLKMLNLVCFLPE